RVLARQPDEARRREDCRDHLPVRQAAQAAAEPQQVQEDLDLVPVELDPERAGTARVLRAVDQVVVEAAAAQPRHDLAAEDLAEVLAGAPHEARSSAA